MPQITLGRRGLLKGAAATVANGPFSQVAFAAAETRYNPDATFELNISEVEYRRTPQGRTLMARVYQPVGPGPFPVVLELHGGGWNTKDRFAEEPFDRVIAAAGALVVAIDMTRAPEAPYPACIQDANMAVRWLKAKAAQWNGDASRIGVFGSSSGGYVAELLMLRPHDPIYGALAADGSRFDATIDYVLARSPISDPFARFENAETMKNAAMVKNNTTFFVPWETIHASNPREILERREKAELKPLLVMQGELDDNMRPAAQRRFVDAFRAAGGKVDYAVFPGSPHEWVATPGAQTDRAHAMAKAFIAAQVNS